MKKNPSLFLYLCLPFLSILTVNPAKAALIITDIGAYSIASSNYSDLSGITYAGGNSYYVVSNAQNAFYPATISINLSNGVINSATVGTGITITGSDHEGIAYNSLNSSVFVSSETDHSIREYRVSNGALLGSITVPTVFSNARPNLSLESLTRQSGGQSLWTANEEALNNDGLDGTSSQGTVVRLQKFDANLNPVGQWAYPVTIGTPTIGKDGVSDLLVLPNGQLLVLEREAGFGINGFQNRLYLVDFTGATDISSLTSGLAGQTYTHVSKTLLWQRNFSNINFEGITLGSQLTNGDYSILLISDDQGSTPQLGESLYSLKLSGLESQTTTPEPDPLMGVLTLGIMSLGGILTDIFRKKIKKFFL